MKQFDCYNSSEKIFSPASDDSPARLLSVAGLLMFLWSTEVKADQTLVSGTISSQVWVQANSPYCVVGDIQVASLAIEPGVVVLFESNYVLQVDGVLTAVGTEQLPIVFTQTNNAGGWGGIFFHSSAPGSVLDHCRIERSIHSGISITNSLPALRNCLIRDNSSPGSGGGISADLATGDLVLEDCMITNNTARFNGGGVHAILRGGFTLRMSGCTISGNTANPASSAGASTGGGIHVEGNSTFNRCVISDNTCNSCAETFSERHCKGGGIYSSAGQASLRNCVLKGNRARAFCCGSFTTCRAYGGGISLGSGTLTAINCILLNNSASGGTSSSGGGIHIEPASSSVNLVNDSIAYNTPEGLAAAGGAVTVLNSILYFNGGGGTQISGAANVSYSDVQGGYVGVGNKNVNPIFQSFTDLRIVPGSGCINMGDPDPDHNDVCFPPSLGTARNDMGAHGGPGGCCWLAPCPPPQIQAQPQGQEACLGRDATLCVTATGAEMLSYQWRSNGVNIAGATNACYTISPVSTTNTVNYSVVVADSFGTTASSNASLAVLPLCVTIGQDLALTIGGMVGQSYSIEYVDSLMETNNWLLLTNLLQVTPGMLFIDPAPPASRPQRYYRVRPAL